MSKMTFLNNKPSLLTAKEAYIAEHAFTEPWLCLLVSFDQDRGLIFKQRL